MSYYNVICNNCKYEEEDFEQSITKNFPAKCPSCKKKKLVQDYSIPKDITGHVYEIKTALQQSEKNIKDMGKEQAQIKFDNLPQTKKKKAPKPWYWSEGQEKPLDITKIKDTKRFIETGEK